ncbi:molecular chaperone TorD family protein [Halorussus salinisoli]|uniref:molecular chaperone TorD family protein n=1 Tax=Halorussus salinisoli TaxID=2558242 RepID=UPI0010C1C31E|nr:molecular chaperone TorD family protein [Halorussus salinisoli]
MGTNSDDADAAGRLRQADLDADAAARGGLYALLARAFEHPDEAFYEALADADLREQVESLVERTPLSVPVESLDTDDDFDTLCARYNDVFVLGYAEYEDRTDGSLSTDEPPVPLYESAYRPNASWNDVNLDLARAYDYYGLQPDESDREHHDHLRLQLEFAGYLARREAAFDGDDDAIARFDFLDRHLRILVEGVVERTRDEPNTGAYGQFAELLDAFTAADRRDLAARLDGGPP